MAFAAGCFLRDSKPRYGQEGLLFAPANGPRSVAVAPALNLSGQRGVDPLLQADLLYQELQQVRGLTVVPVNRVAETLVALNLPQIESAEQAGIVCRTLGVDALIVPTVTLYDPYSPPKLGASLQMFRVDPGASADGRGLDPRELTRRSTPSSVEPLPRNADFIQAARVFDAQAGTTRAGRWASGSTCCTWTATPGSCGTS